MLKKIFFILMLTNLITISTDIFAGRGFGSGFGLGLLGGALVTSAAYNGYPGYGYYPASPYPYAYGNAYGAPYSYYGYSGYNPYW